MYRMKFSLLLSKNCPSTFHSITKITWLTGDVQDSKLLKTVQILALSMPHEHILHTWAGDGGGHDTSLGPRDRHTAPTLQIFIAVW